MPTLLDHQVDALRFMVENRHRGIMLYHSMGSGKTISALSIGAALRSIREINNIVVICPLNVKKVWEREALRCGMIIVVMTHNSFHKYNFGKLNTLLIVDEAHNFRTLIVEKKNKNRQKSFQFLRAASMSKRVLLLTGTPIVNNVLDLRNLIMAMTGESYISKQAYKDHMLRGRALVKRASSLTHAYIHNRHETLPEVTYHKHDFNMNTEYQKWYETVEQNVMESLMLTGVKFAFFSQHARAFWNGVRRATNGRVGSGGVIESPKLDWLVNHILQWKKNGEKSIVYSAWKTYGMGLIKEYIRINGGDDASIRIGVIDGSIRDDERASLVREYNADRLDILLFTAAASEGMNLLATRHVVILEPHWNNARTDQAVFRAVRMNSHSLLPPNQRNVSVHRLLLHKTGECELDSIDDMLTYMSEQKKKLVYAFDKTLGYACDEDECDEDECDEDECDEDECDEDECDY
jgi:SNF2 family DNA or RNA helicase